jgi:hypothetical protein
MVDNPLIVEDIARKNVADLKVSFPVAGRCEYLFDNRPG